MVNPPASAISPAEQDRVQAAIRQAEANCSSEIVTVLAKQSDTYNDVALVWSMAAGLLFMTAFAYAPDSFLSAISKSAGLWGHDWSIQSALLATLFLVPLVVLLTWTILIWRRARIALVPQSILLDRVHRRATEYFRTGIEYRTHRRTGILVYLSLLEHRAEILADEQIARHIQPEVWGDAMAALLSHMKQGHTIDGLCQAITMIGLVLAERFPQEQDAGKDDNEIPDRPIEL